MTYLDASDKGQKKDRGGNDHSRWVISWGTRNPQLDATVKAEAVKVLELLLSACSPELAGGDQDQLEKACMDVESD